MIGDNVTEYEKRALDPCWHTNKPVSPCSPSIHTTLATYIVEKMEVVTGSIVERKRKTISS